MNRGTVGQSRPAHHGYPWGGKRIRQPESSGVCLLLRGAGELKNSAFNERAVVGPDARITSASRVKGASGYLKVAGLFGPTDRRCRLKISAFNQRALGQSRSTHHGCQ